MKASSCAKIGNTSPLRISQLTTIVTIDKFPFDSLLSYYKFEALKQAMDDIHAGKVSRNHSFLKIVLTHHSDHQTGAYFLSPARYRASR